MIPDHAEPTQTPMEPETWIDPRSWTEEGLVRAAQLGNRTALNELLERHRHLVYGALRRYTESNEEAEDLVQDVMLRAFQNLSGFRNESRFSSWLIAIGINAARSARRKTGQVHWVYLDEPKQFDEPFPVHELLDGGHTPELFCIHKERHDLLVGKMRRLVPKYRSVLKRTDIDGLPIRSTAELLGIPLGTAKSRLRRARHILCVSLRPYMGSPKDAGAGSAKLRLDRQSEAL